MSVICVFHFDIFLPGLRVRIRSETGLGDNACTVDREAFWFAMVPSNPQSGSTLLSRRAAQPGGKHYSKELYPVLGLLMVMDFDALY